MPPGLKTLAAVVAAAAMVGAAVIGRNALDTKSERDGLRLTVVCDPLAEVFCQAAAAADDRLTIKVESPGVTTRQLVDLDAGERPDFQAWVSVGPWLQMADGDPGGQASYSKDIVYVASSGLVLVTKPGQDFASCGKPAPAACLPLPSNPVGLPSPLSSGIGLAGLAQIVLAATGIAADTLDRTAIESGPVDLVIGRLRRNTNPTAGLEQLNISFSQANPLVTTRATAPPASSRAQVLESDPPVRAVLQVGILDTVAMAPLRDLPGGRALARAAMDAGWDPPGDPSGGLPDPGVLAALREAWTGP